MSALLNDAMEALRRIRESRDYHAEHGRYPEKYFGPDQSFDDWAADIAETILQSVPQPAITPRDQQILALAAEQIKWTDELEIGDPGDMHVMVSEGDDNGAFVRAWVWVDFANTNLDKEPADA